MKRVLITGKNSYVGSNVERWLMKEPEKYHVESISLRDPNWKNFDFSKFDVVFHVTGIAHVSTKKSMKELYFKINKDLVIEVAQKAKKSGVIQFVFMSSIIVYGNLKESAGKIGISTIPNPSNFYGSSKLQAEIELKKIESEQFKIAIIRAPMIYGYKSKGNYAKISKISKKLVIFPDFKNKRSMIYIDNLNEFIKIIITNNCFGVFFPQNFDYVNTTGIVREISKMYNKNVYFTTIFNGIIKKLIFIKLLNKIFGNLYYEKEMSNFDSYKYQIKTFKESVLSSEILNYREISHDSKIST